MKNPFKKKKQAFPTTPVPRTAEDIKKAYLERLARVGEFQYQISVFTDEVAKLNNELRELNYEMDARNKLNAQAAAEAKATEGATNGQG